MVRPLAGTGLGEGVGTGVGTGVGVATGVGVGFGVELVDGVLPQPVAVRATIRLATTSPEVRRPDRRCPGRLMLAVKPSFPRD
jgi:hypothetical protein